MANLEPWEHSEVFFPSFPLHSFLLSSHCPLLFPTLYSSSPSFPSYPLPTTYPSLISPPFPYLHSPPLSGSNNFNDFPENQLTIDFAFLCKPAWWNTTVSPFPLVLISFGETALPHKIFGGTAFPLAYTTAKDGLSLIFPKWQRARPGRARPDENVPGRACRPLVLVVVVLAVMVVITLVVVSVNWDCIIHTYVMLVSYTAGTEDTPLAISHRNNGRIVYVYEPTLGNIVCILLYFIFIHQNGRNTQQ